MSWISDVVFIIAGLSVHLWYLYHTTFVDWSEMLLYPWFLTKGLLYYRDIVLAYVPGAYYLLFVLYKLLGFTVSSERIIAYGFILLTDVLVYVASKRLTKNKWFAAASLAFFIFWQPIFYGNTIWYETILAPIYLLTLLAVSSYFEKPNTNNAFSIGLMLALASLMKQTAVWSILVVCIAVWLSDQKKLVGFWRAIVVGIVPVAANALVWAYFSFMGAGKEYIYWSYGFLLSLSRASSDYVLLPSRGDLVTILPAFIPLAVMPWLRRNRTVWLILFWTAALITAGLPRWGLFRLQPSLAFGAIGLALLVKEIAQRKAKKMTVAVWLLAFIMSVGSWRSLRVFTTIRDRMQPQFFTGTYQSLLDFSRIHLDKPFYILGNYDYLYYGLDRRPTVLPWVPLFPWNAQVSGLQQRLIISLEEQKVPYILYMPFHGNSGYYLDYIPKELLLYVTSKYEKIVELPVEGGWLYVRK